MYPFQRSGVCTNWARLFLLFASKISAVSFLRSTRDATSTDELDGSPQQFSEDDDLDLCLYYLRTMHNVLSCTGQIPWTIMGSKHVSVRGENMQISSTCTNPRLVFSLLMHCSWRRGKRTNTPGFTASDLGRVHHWRVRHAKQRACG